MAELQFEAPLAKFDDEWNDFHDFHTDADLENSNKEPSVRTSTSTMATSERLERNENTVAGQDLDNFSETFSGSLEDLVSSFDEKISKCFCNFEEKVEKFAPVQVRTQEEIMNDCQ